MYDKRTSHQKKDQAVDFARDLAESSEHSAREEEPAGTSAISNTKHTSTIIAPGGFVALVEKDSTLSNPKILIGRISHYTKPGEEVALLHYENVKGSNNNYALTFDGSLWTEAVDSLVSVKMSKSKKVPDQYVLNVSKRSIHKEIFAP